MSSQAWEGFGQHMLKCILVLVGMASVLATNVDIIFISLVAFYGLTRDGFSQHKMSYILCPR